MKLYYKNRSNSYFVSNPKTFENKAISEDIVSEAYYYAYHMIYAAGFEQRFPDIPNNHYSKLSLFCNIFQVKLSEVLIYSAFVKSNRTPEMTAIKVKSQGIIEFCDMVCEGQNIKIKTGVESEDIFTLEQSKWNKEGFFIPGLKEDTKGLYDYFLMVRLSKDLSEFLQTIRKMNIDLPSDEQLFKKMLPKKITYDIPGFFSQSKLKQLINKDYVLPKDALINPDRIVESDKYYLQTGNLREFSELISEL